MEFKDKIKARRLELKLTLKEVAERVGVSEPTIQRYESGQIKNVRRDKIKLLADALEVTPAYLMDWEEKNEPEPIETIAANHNGEWTPEELEELERYKQFLRSKRDKK
ncbi:MAG: helix-turn-helix domain-containing protein [Clostridiaceae bacterium]